MPAGCPIIRKPDDISLVAAALQRSATISAVIRRAPQLGFLIRAINPAADMSDEGLSRHVIAHAVLREERQTAATAALSLVARSKPLAKVFDIDDTGFVTLRLKTRKTAKPVHINDLLEGKALNRYDLTPEQKAALKLRKDIWDDARFYYNQFGGKLSVEDDLFPRQIHGFVDAAGKFSAGDGLAQRSRYGGSPLSVGGTFTRSRAMNPDGSIRSSAQMVGEGWRYVDPDAVLHAKVLEVSRRTADEQFVRWLTAQPNILKKKDILGSGVKTGVHDARWGMYGFDAAQTPGLAGYYGTKEQVQYINELLSVDSKAVVPGVTWLVNESRGLIASMDFGTTGVQLLAALGADTGHLLVSAATLGRLSKPSNIFGTAVYNSFKSWFSESNLSNYYAANKDVIDRWAPYLGGLKNSEYVSGLLRAPNKSVVTKIPTMRRFARSFEASLDIAKIEYIKSLERINGMDMTRAEKEALGGWVRNSTGMTSTSRIGVSARQQDIEATWLFFSPRFTRSLFAMTATLLKADKAGNEARLALGGFAAAAVSTYLLAAYATGQEPDLNPTKNGRFNADFMTLRIGDNRVGIGGGMRALARLSAESYESAKTDPTRFISPDFRGAHSNPLLAFWRSRSAPLTGTILDIYSGEDFKGTPIEDGNDYVSLLKGRTLPFSLQAALEANGQADTRAGVALAAGFGMNSSPISAYQLYDEYLRDIRMADGSQRFPEGANTAHTEENDFKNFIQYDPQAKHFKDNYEESRLTGSRPGRDIQRILDERSQRIEAADTLLAQTGDYRRYRTQINTIRADSRTTMQTLHLDSIRQSGDKKVVQSWYETYADPRAIDPVTGGINSDGLESLQDEWKRLNPGEWERLIEPSEVIGSTAMESELRSDRKAIADSGWWDADQTSWDELKEIVAARSVDGKFKASSYKTYEDYQLGRRDQYVEQFRTAGRARPELLADIAMQRDPLVAAFNKIRTRNRILLQRESPELISLLEKWGYNHVSMDEYLMATGSRRVPSNAMLRRQYRITPADLRVKPLRAV